MNSIHQRITEILLNDFKVRVAIDPETQFADLGFDSLVIVELALALDNEFAIALRDGELTDTMTITDAAELVVAKGAVP